MGCLQSPGRPFRACEGYLAQHPPVKKESWVAVNREALSCHPGPQASDNRHSLDLFQTELITYTYTHLERLRNQPILGRSYSHPPLISKIDAFKLGLLHIKGYQAERGYCALLLYVAIDFACFVDSLRPTTPP